MLAQLFIGQILTLVGWFVQREVIHLRHARPPGTPPSALSGILVLIVFAVAFYRGWITFRATTFLKMRFAILWTILSLPPIGFVVLWFLDSRVRKVWKETGAAQPV